jgi:DNA-binding transcriptional ArsR family regulator
MKNTLFDEYSNVFKALGDEKRLRILMLLKTRSLCVCELSEALDTPFSTLSAHLKILKNARLVEDLKDGRWVVYRLAGDKPVIRNLLEMLEAGLREDEKFLKDRSTAARVTRELCSVILREKQKKRRAGAALEIQDRQPRKKTKSKGLIFSTRT